MSKLNLEPIADRIVVAREKSEIEKNGIIIPETAAEEKAEGIVVAVGPGRITENGEVIPMKLKIGDKVMLNPYAVSPIKHNGEIYLIMRECDVLAKILKEEELIIKA